MRATERAALAQAIERQDMAEIERAAIARRIKSARNEAGLSQPEMAEALGVISRTYQNYESVSAPRTPWALMNDIARITGKTTEWLIHGEKATAPNLLGSMVRVDDHIERMADEFRGYVDPNPFPPAGDSDQLDRIERLLADNHQAMQRSLNEIAARAREEREELLERIAKLEQALQRSLTKAIAENVDEMVAAADLLRRGSGPSRQAAPSRSRSTRAGA